MKRLRQILLLVFLCLVSYSYANVSIGKSNDSNKEIYTNNKTKSSKFVYRDGSYRVGKSNPYLYKPNKTGYYANDAYVVTVSSDNKKVYVALVLDNVEVERKHIKAKESCQFVGNHKGYVKIRIYNSDFGIASGVYMIGTR